MKRLRKTTWTMLIWTILSGLLTVLWMSGDVSGASSLKVGEAAQVDDDFEVTLTSEDPPTFTIRNTITSDAFFDFSNLTMTDSEGAEHEPTFAISQIGATVPASGSISQEIDFGNLGRARAVSFHWECDACDAAEAIGRALIFVVMGGVYWFGMLVLFIVWLVSRPPRVIVVSADPEEPESA